MLILRLLHLLHRPLASAGLLAARCLALPTMAAPITDSFGGTVSDDTADRGDSSFSFDRGTSDGIPDPGTAAYAHSGSPWELTLSLDGGTAFTDNSPFKVLVSNDLASTDQWGLLGQDTNGNSLSLTLTDLLATEFSSDALPTSALTAASIGWRTLSGEADGQTLNGMITELPCSVCGSTGHSLLHGPRQ